MPSTFTDSLRLNKQATGENTNTWGNILNSGAIELIDFGADGTVTISASGATTLTTANGTTDQARGRILNYTGSTAGTLTIPSVSKFYIVRAATANCTVTNGGSSVTVIAGDTQIIFTNGTTVWLLLATNFGGTRLKNVGGPTAQTDAATKQFVEDTAFATQAGDFPGLPDNRGRYLQVQDDESGPQWDLGWERKTANFDAIPGGKYLVDTSGGAVTATLWTDANDGDSAWFKDGGFTLTNAGWQTNNLTLARNGSTIMGLTENLACNVRGGVVGVTYQSADYKVI